MSHPEIYTTEVGCYLLGQLVYLLGDLDRATAVILFARGTGPLLIGDAIVARVALLLLEAVSPRVWAVRCGRPSALEDRH